MRTQQLVSPVPLVDEVPVVIGPKLELVHQIGKLPFCCGRVLQAPSSHCFSRAVGDEKLAIVRGLAPCLDEERHAPVPAAGAGLGAQLRLW